MWRYRQEKDEKGAQIDLLIDRRDHCINVCEKKISTDKFEITKAYAGELENKLKVFRGNTKTRKTLFFTMITSYGVKNEIITKGCFKMK
ncbi:MAG: ATPase [Aquabacterium sp.]|nr:ATPase [Ferruginibacter sp.]